MLWFSCLTIPLERGRVGETGEKHRLAHDFSQKDPYFSELWTPGYTFGNNSPLSYLLPSRYSALSFCPESLQGEFPRWR